MRRNASDPVPPPSAIKRGVVGLCLEQLRERPAIGLLDLPLGLAHGLGVGHRFGRLGRELVEPVPERVGAFLQVDRHLQRVAVRGDVERLHLPHRGLGVVENVIDAFDGAEDLLAVHRRGERVAQNDDVAPFQLVALFFENVGDMRALGRIAGVHEVDEFLHRRDEKIALIVHQSVEVRHARKYPVDQSGDDAF